MYKRVIVALCAAALSITGLAASDGHDGDKGGQNPGDRQVRLQTTLAGPAIKGMRPTGQAEFRADNNGLRFRVEVQDVNLHDGTVLGVSVSHDGTSMNVGVLTLSGGSDELELRTQDGERVPHIQRGDLIHISQNGMVILTGVF